MSPSSCSTTLSHLLRGPTLSDTRRFFCCILMVKLMYGYMLLLRRMRMLRAGCPTSGGCLRVTRRLRQTSRSCELLTRLSCCKVNTTGLGSNVICIITFVDFVLVIRIAAMDIASFILLSLLTMGISECCSRHARQNMERSKCTCTEGSVEDAAEAYGLLATVVWYCHLISAL